MDSQFTCSACGMKFNTQDEMMDHGKTAHQISSQDEHIEDHQSPSASQEHFKCSMCGATFSSQEEMSAHAKEKHGGGM